MKSYSEDEILAAINGSFGIVSTVAKKLKCQWNTAKTYIDKYENAKTAYSNELEKALDLAEYKILEAINLDDTSTARWYLSTKGKTRGYSERQEFTGADGKDIPVNTLMFTIQYRDPAADDTVNAVTDSKEARQTQSKESTRRQNK